MITSLCWGARLTVVRNHGTFSFVTTHQAGLSEVRSQSAGSPRPTGASCAWWRQRNAIDGARSSACTRTAHMLHPEAAHKPALCYLPLLWYGPSPITVFLHSSNNQLARQCAGSSQALLAQNKMGYTEWITQRSQFGVRVRTYFYCIPIRPRSNNTMCWFLSPPLNKGPSMALICLNRCTHTQTQMENFYFLTCSPKK